MGHRACRTYAAHAPCCEAWAHSSPEGPLPRGPLPEPPYPACYDALRHMKTTQGSLVLIHNIPRRCTHQSAGGLPHRGGAPDHGEGDARQVKAAGSDSHIGVSGPKQHPIRLLRLPRAPPCGHGLAPSRVLSPHRAYGTVFTPGRPAPRWLTTRCGGSGASSGRSPACGTPGSSCAGCTGAGVSHGLGSKFVRQQSRGRDGAIGKAGGHTTAHRSCACWAGIVCKRMFIHCAGRGARA